MTTIAMVPATEGPPAISGIVDLYPAAEHELGAEVTSYPVEQGASLTDNVVIRPKKLRVSGLVANLLAAPGRTAGPEKAQDAWQAIIGLMESRERMTVATALGDYDEMVIVRVKSRMDAQTGISLAFDMDLQEVLVGIAESSSPAGGNAGGGGGGSGPAADRPAASDGGQRQPAPLPAFITAGISAIKNAFAGALRQ